MDDRSKQSQDRDAANRARYDAEPALDRVDEASAESFPASDPPSWMAMRVGEPKSPANPA